MKTYKCRLQKDEIEDGVLHCVLKSKPDWCPIRPVLEKKPLTGDVSNSEKAGNELVRAGWNACIDEILKGVDENGNESV